MKSRLPFLLATALVVVVLAACGSVVPYAATVGDNKISQDDLESELRAIAGNEQYLKYVESQTQVQGTGKGVFDAAFTAQVLTSQIVYELVTEELDKRKVTVTQADLDAARPTVVERVGGEEVFNAFSRDYQETLVRRAADVNALTIALLGQGDAEAAAKAYYDANPAQFNQTCASHILVPTKEQADAIKARLDRGEDFAAVARVESKDSASAARGGDLGCFEGDNQLNPEFAQAAFSQAVNEVGPPVQTQFGFHLIKVNSRASPPYEQVAAAARDRAIAAGREKLAEWFTGAVDTTEVSVNPKYGHFEKQGQNSSVVPPQAPTTTPPESVPGEPSPVPGAPPAPNP
ncbi:MAG: peptidylprolyl isomerase [Actinomycetota bacterium]|nr:peptidylprolyl isomerase [Actinomycetota bacterium]